MVQPPALSPHATQLICTGSRRGAPLYLAGARDAAWRPSASKGLAASCGLPRRAPVRLVVMLSKVAAHTPASPH